MKIQSLKIDSGRQIALNSCFPPDSPFIEKLLKYLVLSLDQPQISKHQALMRKIISEFWSAQKSMYAVGTIVIRWSQVIFFFLSVFYDCILLYKYCIWMIVIHGEFYFCETCLQRFYEWNRVLFMVAFRTAKKLYTASETQDQFKVYA